MNVLLILDLDGTLADTRTDIAAAVNKVRESYGMTAFPADKITGYIGGGRRQLMLKSLHDYPELDIDDSCSRFTDFYNQDLIVETCLYEGVEATVQQLHSEGYYLAVLSNKPGEMCRAIVSHFGLEKYLVTTMGGGDTATTKPDPEGAFEVIRRAEEKGFVKEDGNIWMAGDHHTDLAVAENAGMKSIFCEYGFGDRQNLKSDYSIKSFSEIPEIIR